MPPLRGLRHHQRGYALLLTMVALLFGFAALFYTLVSPANIAIEGNRITSAALARAKDALIGYAVKDSNRPGSLPCPDTDNDGSVEIFSGTDCQGYVSGNVYIGRLPWRTLDLPDLRGASGERLWYAVSLAFARNPAGAPALNSDTKGQLTITGTSPATQVVAIVFDPGLAVGSQLRNAANEGNVANYLEGGNENGDTSYATAAASATFNDRLLAVAAADIMIPVEKRVAREMLKLLDQYFTAAGYYPWAAQNFGGGASDIGRRRGGVPLASAYTVSSPGTADWALQVPPITVPPWLVNNEWWKVTHYAISEDRAPSGDSDTLEFEGSSGKHIILYTTGPAGANRPSSDLCDYLDLANNCNDNDQYWLPTSTTYARNRVYVIP